MPVLSCTKSSIFEHIRHQRAYQVFLHTSTRFVHDVTTPAMDCVTGLRHTMYITIIYSPTLQKHSGYDVTTPAMDHTFYDMGYDTLHRPLPVIYSPALQKHSGYTVSSLTTYTTDIYKHGSLTENAIKCGNVVRTVRY